MADRLRAVLVGCGGISAVWLSAVPQADGLEIVGLVDIDESAAAARRDEHGLKSAQVGTNLESMLSAARPDIVFDCTVPEAHVDVTLKALRHGCHVLSEKPLADSMENARRMVEAAQKSGKLHAVMQNRRYDARIRALRALLDSGRIGELTTLNSDFYIGAHFGGFRDHMRHPLILDMAIHTFDQARLISGTDPVAVYCKEWNPKGSWYDHDASAVCVFEMTKGLVFVYRGSWCAEGLHTTWESSWRCIGETGSVTWDGADEFHAQVVSGSEGFFRDRADVEIVVPETDKSGGHAGLISDFVRCVRSGEMPETTCTDNIKSLAMVFGAIQSAQEGRRVEIRT